MNLALEGFGMTILWPNCRTSRGCPPIWEILKPGLERRGRKAPWADGTTVSLHHFVDAGSLSLGRQSPVRI